MSDEGRAHPDCINASNPYHECVEYCFRKIAEAKARRDQEAEKREAEVRDGASENTHNRSEDPDRHEVVSEDNAASGDDHSEENVEENYANLTGRQILLEDLDRFKEALDYISSLEPYLAGITVKEYGKILVEHKPVETIDILMRLCTVDEESSTKKASSGTHLSILPSPVDFLNIFIHHPQALMDFFEKYIGKVEDSPVQVEIHNTLLELYLSNDLNFPPLSQENGFVAPYLEGTSSLGASTSTTAESKDVNKEKEHKQRLEKGLALLKRAWPADMEQPLYDVGIAVFLCEMNSFNEGLLFLYEKMKLYKEVIGCYMQARDHEGLIVAARG